MRTTLLDITRFMVYTCLPNGEPDKASLRVQLYSRAKTMRQVTPAQNLEFKYT